MGKLGGVEGCGAELGGVKGGKTVVKICCIV